jgi:hypothetical protein
MMKVANKLFTLCFLTFCFLGCSDDEVDKVDVTFSPENPRVYFYDKNLILYTDGDGNPVTEEVKGPWFKTSLSVTNGSSKGVVFNKIEFKLTGIAPVGGLQSAASVIEADDLFDNKDQSTANDSDVLVFVQPGETKPIPNIYISNLPPSVTTGVFSVEVIVTGWFGTVENASDIFTQKYFFTTNN